MIIIFFILQHIEFGISPLKFFVYKQKHAWLIRAPPTNVGGALLFSACQSVCLSVRGHSNSVIFNQISSKFHKWIASINFSVKFE